MPIVQITTTLSKGELSTDFGLKFSEFLSTVLKKAIEKFTVVINSDAMIYNGGDMSSPFILINLRSIARFNAETNPVYTEQLVDFMNKETGVPRNKIQILYTDVPPFMTGMGK